jgi:hypothetical protein
VAALAARETADKVVSLQHRLAVLLDQTVGFVARRSFARGSQLDRDHVRGAFVGDAVELDEVFDEGPSVLLGSGTILGAASERGRRDRKAVRFGGQVYVEGDSKASRHGAQGEGRSVARRLLVALVIPLELEPAIGGARDTEGLTSVGSQVPDERYGRSGGQDPPLDETAAQGGGVATAIEGLIGLDHGGGDLTEEARHDGSQAHPSDQEFAQVLRNGFELAGVISRAASGADVEHTREHVEERAGKDP